MCEAISPGAMLCCADLMRNHARDAADYLLGTCQPLHSTEWEDFQDDPVFCDELDSRVMLCECCSWWVETHELDDAGRCEDCKGDDD